MIVGTGYDDQYNALKPAWARALGIAGIGFGSCLVNFTGDDVLYGNDPSWDKKPDLKKYHWQNTTQTIANVNAAGMDIFVKATWMPSAASGGKAIMCRNERGPWINHASWLPNGGWHVPGQCADAPPKKLCPSCVASPQRVAWANDPPMVFDYDWWFSLGRELALRYGELVYAWCAWNEEDESLFSPHIRLANLERITRAEAIRPYQALREAFEAGVRSVISNALCIGPETAYFGGLEQEVQDASEKGGGGALEVAPRRTSVHHYCSDGKTLVDSLEASGKMELWRKHVSPRLYNRLLWLTETDNSGGASHDFIGQLRTLATTYSHVIERVYLAGMWNDLFKSWPPKENEMPILTDLGVGMWNFTRELAQEPPDVSEAIGMLKAATRYLEWTQNVERPGR